MLKLRDFWEFLSDDFLGWRFSVSYFWMPISSRGLLSFPNEPIPLSIWSSPFISSEILSYWFCDSDILASFSRSCSNPYSYYSYSFNLLYFSMLFIRFLLFLAAALASYKPITIPTIVTIPNKQTVTGLSFTINYTQVSFSNYFFSPGWS